jgi:hypothetical protein
MERLGVDALGPQRCVDAKRGRGGGGVPSRYETGSGRANPPRMAERAWPSSVRRSTTEILQAPQFSGAFLLIGVSLGVSTCISTAHMTRDSLLGRHLALLGQKWYDSVNRCGKCGVSCQVRINSGQQPC